MTIAPMPLPTPASALAIAAHPDDVEFQCGATLARWAEDGCVIHHLICTDGSKGTWDPDVVGPELVARRETEQREAARRLAAGAAAGRHGEVVLLGAIDGELQVTPTLVTAVARVLRRLQPAVVLAHDPWRRYRLHPDHRHAGFLAIDGIVAARDPLFVPELLAEGLSPHRPEALLLFEADEANHWEAAEPRHLDRKVHALLAHESQFETTHFKRVAGAPDPAEAFRRRELERLQRAGEPVGLPLAEAFHLIVDQL